LFSSGFPSLPGGFKKIVLRLEPFLFQMFPDQPDNQGRFFEPAIPAIVFEPFSFVRWHQNLNSHWTGHLWRAPQTSRAQGIHISQHMCAVVCSDIGLTKKLLLALRAIPATSRRSASGAAKSPGAHQLGKGVMWQRVIETARAAAVRMVSASIYLFGTP
jgi:hypothetical protein